MLRKDLETTKRWARQIAREEAIKLSGGTSDGRIEDILKRLDAIEKKLAAVDKALGK